MSKNRCVTHGRLMARYTGAYEEFPLQEGVAYRVGDAYFLNTSLENALAGEFISSFDVDYAYIDPPWGTSLVKAFYTRAGLIEDQPTFARFLRFFLRHLRGVRRDIFIEMGLRETPKLIQELESDGAKVKRVWPITYYRSRPCSLLQVYYNESVLNLGDTPNGRDDSETPFIVAEAIKEKSMILDTCTGQGLTAKATIKNGHKFVGVELHPRRLARAVRLINKLTGEPLKEYKWTPRKTQHQNKHSQE